MKNAPTAVGLAHPGLKMWAAAGARKHCNEAPRRQPPSIARNVELPPGLVLRRRCACAADVRVYTRERRPGRITGRQAERPDDEQPAQPDREGAARRLSHSFPLSKKLVFFLLRKTNRSTVQAYRACSRFEPSRPPRPQGVGDPHGPANGLWLHRSCITDWEAGGEWRLLIEPRLSCVLGPMAGRRPLQLSAVLLTPAALVLRNPAAYSMARTAVLYLIYSPLQTHAV